MKYKNFIIELVGGTVEPLYNIYDSLGYYKGQGKSIKECKQYIRDYLL